MPRPCTICAHPDREAIDHALLAGEAASAVARRHGLHRNAIQRHFENHVPESIVRAAAARTEAVALAHGASLLDRVRGAAHALMTIAQEAQADGDRRNAISAYRALLSGAEVLVKVEGHARMGESSDVDEARWARLQGLVFEALSPYPEARAALAQALLTEDEHADPGA